MFYSVWTKETTCKLLKTNIKDKVQCSFNNGEGDENIFQYPCLEVLVDLNFSGQEVMLYHTEETQERNPKVLGFKCIHQNHCSYLSRVVQQVILITKQSTSELTENRAQTC